MESKITDPGFYNMSNREYHKGIGAFAYSKSLLSLLLPPYGNPADLRAEMDTPGEDIFSEKSLRDYNPGTALHTWMLEREKFEDEIVVIPTFSGKGAMAKRSEWEAQVRALAGTVTPIRQSAMDMIEGMDKSLHSGLYETARNILEAPGYKAIERSGFWQDPETGIWLKTRPDLIRADGFEWDLKKYGSGKPFSYQAESLHYDLQAYMMLAGTSIIKGVEHRRAGFIVFHDKPPTYPIEVFRCSEETIEEGEKKFRVAMKILAYCLKTNTWPGLVDAVQVLLPPPWQRKN